jgi:hypothetical protein
MSAAKVEGGNNGTADRAVDALARISGIVAAKLLMPHDNSCQHHSSVAAFAGTLLAVKDAIALLFDTRV